MKGILTDLDNDLTANDAYSGFDSKGLPKFNPNLPNLLSPTQSLVSTGGRPLSPTQSLESTGGRPSPSEGLQEVPIHASQTIAPISNQGNGGDGLGNTTEPVQNNGEMISDGGMLGGGMIGGGGAPQEEEIVEEVAKISDDKILGMNPKLFYGILIAVGIGGAIYFGKKAIKLKVKN